MNRTALLFSLALLLLLASACRAVGLDELTPEQLAARERIVYLVAKSASARLVREGVASADDLARAASVVEAASGGDVGGALAAAGLADPEWELLALLVQEQLEPWRLHPLLPRMVAAAARGVRDGAAGIEPAEGEELGRLRQADAPAGSRGSG